MLNSHSPKSIKNLSKYLPINLGVPQGSIFGPLMFILYMNDIILEIENTKMEIYADDSTLYTSDKAVETINVNLTAQMRDMVPSINKSFKLN